MQSPGMALRISSQGVPNWQAGIAPLFYPLLKAFIRRKLDISTGTVELGMEHARNIITQIDSLLSDGRAYLLGDHFTAADLTFASMMAPFLMPPEYGVRLPRLDEIGVAMRRTVDEMRSTRAGQHALHMYQTERRPTLSRISEINAQDTPQSSLDHVTSVN